MRNFDKFFISYQQSTFVINHHCKHYIANANANGKGNYKLTTLAKIRRYITKDIAIRLYKTLVLPIIDYGDVLYTCVSKTKLDVVQRLQIRALRIVDLSPRYTTNISLHQKYLVLPLYIRRRDNLLKTVHTFLRHNCESCEVA